MQVTISHSDITQAKVDGIVNPANSQGVMNGGVAAAIRDAGGSSIEDEVKNLAPIAIGAAVVTKAGDLSAKYIIHAPLMAEPGQLIGPENIRRAARAALIAANHLKMTTIAMPGMGTNEGAVPRMEAARAIIEEIRAHKKEFPETVFLTDIEDAMVEAFDYAMGNTQQHL